MALTHSPCLITVIIGPMKKSSTGIVVASHTTCLEGGQSKKLADFG